MLQPFLPLRARSRNTVTFRSIFDEHSVGSYLEGEDVKKKALQKGFESVIRYHPRLPFAIIRKVVPAAIEYRRYKRDPLKRVELDALAEALVELDIDMRAELGKIILDETVPEIQVPPAELIKRLENHPLTVPIASEPLELFRNGHFNEAVRKAAERFETQVKELSGLPEIGKSLMGKAFSSSNPIVAVADLTTDNGRGIQEGYQLLAMGSMSAIRNVFSHGDEDQRSPEEAYEMLMFFNWMFRNLPSA